MLDAFGFDIAFWTVIVTKEEVIVSMYVVLKDISFNDRETGALGVLA